ncbi:hypothetical protein ACFQ5J_07340 [Lacticaseibacillus baoqingensis]|uniref:Malectin domain-containing protein n=1 Tax=Lacticaseibacillus baoqingensis TaxID=2486013 RepID=A0ABW4E7C4_9LACO|nr:hypothetical protein [Lacticaseibacillus baoqingensis]
MKRWRLVLMVWLGWLVWRGQPVHAQTFAGYDPVQGGMIFDPPEELYAAVGVKTQGLFMYSGPGSIPLTDRKQQESQDQIAVYDAANQLASVTSTFNQGVYSFVPTKPGDYRVELQFTWGAVVYRDSITVHVLEYLPTGLHANIDQHHLFNNVLTPVEWIDQAGRHFSMPIVTPTVNGASWPVGPFAFPSGTSATPVTRDITILGAVFLPNYQPARVYFGLADVTVKAGMPLTIDADYYQPKPGTTLTYSWQFIASASGNRSQIISKVPQLDVPVAWQQDGTLMVRLVYTDNETGAVVTIYSNNIKYHYEPAPKPTLYSGTLPAQHVSIADLITQDVKLPALLPEITLPAGDWQLTIAITAPTTTAGAKLAAALLLPESQTVTPQAPMTIRLQGPQTYSLTQTEWLLYRQVDALAGHYQATISFTAIMGP